MESGAFSASRLSRSNRSRRIEQVLLLLLLPLLLSCKEAAETADDMTSAEPAIPAVSVEQLRQKVLAGEDIFLLDVRTIPEYVSERLAFTDDLISYEQVPDSLGRLPQDRSAPIYLFSRSGRRSGIVTQYLREKGYSNAFNVAGGIVAWKAAGYETISGQ